MYVHFCIYAFRTNVGVFGYIIIILLTVIYIYIVHQLLYLIKRELILFNAVLAKLMPSVACFHPDIKDRVLVGFAALEVKARVDKREWIECPKRLRGRM